MKVCIEVNALEKMRMLIIDRDSENLSPKNLLTPKWINGMEIVAIRKTSEDIMNVSLKS